MRICRFIFGEI